LTFFDPGHQTNKLFFSSSFFWKLSYNQAFRALEQPSSLSGAKIMAQKARLDKNSNPTKDNLGQCWLMAITHQPIELESWSNPLKTRKVL